MNLAVRIQPTEVAKYMQIHDRRREGMPNNAMVLRVPRNLEVIAVKRDPTRAPKGPSPPIKHSS